MGKSKIGSLPLLVVIDREGRIAYLNQGAGTTINQDIRKVLDELLGKD